MLSSIRLMNSGRIPLSLYDVGGLSIVLNFIECPINCSECPWESNINRRSARLVPLNIQKIIDLINQYRADIVFLHGAEPYIYVEYSIIKKIKNGAATTIGIKANPLIARGNQSFEALLDLIDVIVFEVVSNRDEIDLQIQLLQHMLGDSCIKSKHVEIMVVVEVHRDLGELITRIINGIKGSSIPINIVLTNGEYSSLDTTMINKLRERYPLIQAPLADIIEFASTLCPVCRSIAIVRRGGVVYRTSIDDLGKCRVCGYKLVSTKVKKPVKLPLDILLV